MGAYEGNPAAQNLIKGFVAMVRITAKDGEAETVENILRSLVGPSMAEPGIKF